MKQLSVKSSPVLGAEGLWCPTIVFHLGRCGFPVPHTESLCVCVYTSEAVFVLPGAVFVLPGAVCVFPEAWPS